MRMRTIIAVLVMLLGATSMTSAGASETSTSTYRYTGPTHAGWTADQGGLFAELDWPPPSIPVPTWARAATIQVLDDEHRAVHGIASAMSGGYQHERVVFCDQAAVQLVVAGASEVHLRVGLGASSPSLGSTCMRPLSAPSRGLIVVTFAG